MKGLGTSMVGAGISSRGTLNPKDPRAKSSPGHVTIRRIQKAGTGG